MTVKLTGTLAFVVLLGSLWSQTYNAGGLAELATPAIGSNVPTNTSFETGTLPNATSWSISQGYTGFAVVNTTARTGSKSLQYTGSSGSTPVPSIEQSLTLTAGTYELGGYWTSPSGFGSLDHAVRVCLSTSSGGNSNCKELYGTAAGWTAFSETSITVPIGGRYYLDVQSYNAPTSGQIWLDDLYVERDSYPVSGFMTYPNYRGLLFASQSQVMTFDTIVDPPNGTLSDYKTAWTVMDETTSGVVASGNHTSVAHETISLDATGYNAAHTYLVTFSLLLASDSSTVYTYSSYRVIPSAGSVLTSANLAYNSSNQFLSAGTPTFILGVYDSGLDEYATAGQYITQWDVLRRMNQTPINFYYDYWWGAMPTADALVEMDASTTAGMKTMLNVNCVTASPPSGFWAQTASDVDVQSVAAKTAFGGWYVGDECVPSMIPSVFALRARETVLAPGTINWITQTDPNSMPLWRDTVDVLAMDPYPVYGPTSDLSTVATWTKASIDASLGSRPTFTVIQFLGGALGWVWPTLAQLRNMSYMSIAEGANGVVYWELGQGNGGLYSSCDGSTAGYAYHRLVGIVGTAYSDQMWLPGAGTVTTATINSGSLPGGLSMSSSGLVTGTPTTPGTSDINITLNGSITGYVEIIIQSGWTSNYPSGSYGWCSNRVSNFANLVSVTTELAAIQTALASLDDNSKLINNDTPTVHTRVKVGANPTLIASNNTGSAVSPIFTWHAPISTVTVYNESRTITPSGSTFTDSFAAYGAHVYQITEGAGSPSLIKCAPCQGIKVQ